MDRQQSQLQLSEVQDKVLLSEGVRGLIKFLAVIDRFPNSGIRKISRETGFPVPICVAIRNEFVKKGWCKKGNGTVVTPEGKDIFLFFSSQNESFRCGNCEEHGVFFPLKNYEKELELIKKYTQLRGQPDTRIDQSFATSRTSLYRSLYMIHNYDLFSGDYALVGDSDLTSIAISQFVPKSSRITVFDIDSKLENIINTANKELTNKIEFVKHDLRQPILESYHGKFTCIHTDPPYTKQGCRLFISRCVDLINKKTGGAIYLSFGNKPPVEMKQIQEDLLKMGCVITNILPNFNKYIGAQKLGGVSTLYRLQVVSSAIPIMDGRYEGMLYTGEINPIIRTYKCQNCNNTTTVGIKEEFPTIEELKNKGCPMCKMSSFVKISEKKREEF